jgi:hypothetical protein
MKTGPEGPVSGGGRSRQLRSARGAAVSVLPVDESVLVEPVEGVVEVLLSVVDGALMVPEGAVCVSVDVLGDVDVLGVVLVLLSGVAVVAGGFVSAGEGVVVWAMLMPAAVTSATTPAMLKLLGRFFIRLTPFP